MTILERGQLEVLTAKHGRSLRLLCTVGGNLAKLNARLGGTRQSREKEEGPKSSQSIIVILAFLNRFGDIILCRDCFVGCKPIGKHR